MHTHTQIAVYDSDAPVTLKQGQDHQIWHELVDPKQGYNSAKFEKPLLNRVDEKANEKGFAKSGNMPVISTACVPKSKIVVCL